MAPFRIAIIPVTAFEQNCSIVWCTATNEAAVVDPGGDVDQILAAIAETKVNVTQILLTHGHIDHAAGADELRERLSAESDAPVPVIGPHPDDRFLLQSLVEAGQRWGQTGCRNVEPDRWLAEGDRVTIGTVGFDILHCPGHSPGSVVYVYREAGDAGTPGPARFCFMGDVLFKGSIGRTDLPRGDHPQLLRSIFDKIIPLGDDVTFLPGHGPVSTVGAERRSNPFLV
jgi:glyoxylase-like metal-dependent hydrolase (beta-lactamase superfamily II)